METRYYIAIDLKSFYASVECVDRGLDPLCTNLVVADESRTEKTICLALTPTMKQYGLSGRSRLFEVVSRINEVNKERSRNIGGSAFFARSFDNNRIISDPYCEVSYITAKPRMRRYMEYSTEIYGIYLRYIAPEDIHPYSIDEVFIDATPYLRTYNISAYKLAEKIIYDIYKTTGITATAGVGTNLYLCKIAMDIVAKHKQPDKNGVRIAFLDEALYRKLLWDHRPITDFWRIGRGYAERLRKNGMYTMGDIARCSIGSSSDYYNARLLYKLFGVNAELIIDHAWGYEPCTISDIKAYRPKSTSISQGQVLLRPYTFDEARIVLKEMSELLSLDLVKKRQKTNSLTLDIGYDIENITNKDRGYVGSIKTDHYGRKIPPPSHGSVRLDGYSSSTELITEKLLSIYDRITDSRLLLRRITIAACGLMAEEIIPEKDFTQLSFFSQESTHDTDEDFYQRERRMQEVMLSVKRKFGKNALFRMSDLQDAATTLQRNAQVGGHSA